eukprot:3425028-Amphidinium_carterae.1
MIAAIHGSVDDAEDYWNPGKTEDLTRSAVGLTSEQWGREAEAEPNNKTNHITSVATLAMSATYASRTWIIDTGAAQHLVG